MSNMHSCVAQHKLKYLDSAQVMIAREESQLARQTDGHSDATHGLDKLISKLASDSHPPKSSWSRLEVCQHCATQQCVLLFVWLCLHSDAM